MATKKNAITKVAHDWGAYYDLEAFFNRLREKIAHEGEGKDYWADRSIESADIRDVLRTHMHFGFPAKCATERMGLELGMADAELEVQLTIFLETFAEAWEKTACYGRRALLLERRVRLKVCQHVSEMFAKEFLNAIGAAFQASVPNHPVMLEGAR